MFNKSKILGSIAGLGLLFGTASSVATAQMPTHSSEQTSQFRRIEQPLPLKVGVTLGGLGLIGLELWWFLFSKNKATKANSEQGIQELTINVDGGYEPDRVIVKSGQPVRLNFFRRDPSSCLEKVLLPDFHIAQDLPLNHITPIEFTPPKPGQYQFTCGMNMFRGVVEVQ
ncbi:cupredoxin domain-containing protein [Komarekiella sp. 'clone 1']|uniref:Cupredoxin domain-containing protein n=1 Tax=Komarekiella delphini-convector SJRDD-AB1 TaxID=2593771 RepID=A0AA40SUF6_9NOST|nr:cupredoxin domain-containing protein [Komarekiella delphini-convector]MBD6615456.1 cupredoxin domain-containing protein [Komarekiella delphini-convector SJRDD-AB1]